MKKKRKHLCRWAMGTAWDGERVALCVGPGRCERKLSLSQIDRILNAYERNKAKKGKKK